eukprot:TRINITY_DN59609_c0_g1_i1.p2 TRINITY_DN59609_c0_g1~~TRINITY_DN59609_c0_g1_i1.p2  ORF type:complete len:54 (-),score=9.66 TRINITY_DN59609_c0_g1_i1:48-209(-)
MAITSGTESTLITSFNCSRPTRYQSSVFSTPNFFAKYSTNSFCFVSSVLSSFL